MIEIAAAVLADHIQNAAAVHRQAFMLLGGNGQGIAGIGVNRQRVVDDAGSVDVDNLSRFLAQNQQMGRIRPGQRL